MNHEQSFQKIRGQIARDLKPVRPLATPWQRAFVFLSLCLATVALVIVVFGLRADYSNLGPLAAWGLSGIQLSLAYLLVLLALRTVIPGLAVAPSILVTVFALSIAMNLLFSWATFYLSPLTADPGREWQTGFACLFAICFFSAGPITLCWTLATRGLVSNPRLTSVAIGLGGGLAAEAGWRLHCPVSSPEHVLPFHTGAVGLAVGSGILLGLWWHSKEDSSTGTSVGNAALLEGLDPRSKEKGGRNRPPKAGSA